MTPFGDRGRLFELPTAPRGALLARLRAIAGVRDVVLAERTGLVVFEDESPTAAVAAALAAPFAAEETASRLHRIEVLYDGEDLAAVAATVGRTVDDVVRLHAEPEYRVALVGFAPGFAYLRGIAPELVLSRRAPRPRVPAGSVAIAAGYSGVYPFASPGGWHLLGRAPRFAPFVDGAAVLALDDRVRFEPGDDAPNVAATPDTEAVTGPYLELTLAQGVAFLVDGGRPGRMHEGIPPGGPLVRGGLVAANRCAGNPDLACGLELYGTFEVTARGGRVVVAAAACIVLEDGASYRITSGAARVTYLAVAGGIAAPTVLGSRGVFRVAGIGGPLRRGARLAVGDAAAASFPADRATDSLGANEPIPLLPGPDGDVHAHLHELTVAVASDRTGVRLERYAGPSLGGPRDRPSIPMLVGAMELTPSGPIVLGPDHPTTGGYPVVGVVPNDALDAFFARPVGARVSFRRS